MKEVPVTPACACGSAKSTGYCGVPVDDELMPRLDEMLAEYKGKPGALIPVLQIAQGIFGYLPQKVLKRIALSLGKSYSEVAGVTGFYSFFSTVPRGKHLIRVCLGTACYVRGGKQILETLKQELELEIGGTTPDGLFSLEVARCFGACGLAPTMMIDEVVHQRVKPLKVRAILEACRNGSAGGNGHALPAAKAAAPAKRGTTNKPRPRTAGSRRSAAGRAKRKAAVK